MTRRPVKNYPLKPDRVAVAWRKLVLRSILEIRASFLKKPKRDGETGNEIETKPRDEIKSFRVAANTSATVTSGPEVQVNYRTVSYS